METLQWILYLVAAILLFIAAFGIGVKRVSLVTLAAALIVTGFLVLPGIPS